MISKPYALSLLAVIAGLIWGGLGSPAALAQQRNHPVKNISLSVGVFDDQPIPLAPPNFDKDGTYASIAKLQYDAGTKTLRINPRKTGIGTLFIKDPITGRIIYEFHLDVKKIDLAKVAREIRSLLAEVEGINIKIANNKVIVDGTVLLPKDITRINSVVAQFGNFASSLVTLSPIAQVKIAQFIEKAIGNQDIRVKAVNGIFILEGAVDSEQEKADAYTLALTYVPDVVLPADEGATKTVQRRREPVVNMIRVRPPAERPPSKIIQIVVHFVELNKDYTRGFRFQWTPELGEDTQLQFTDRGPGGVISSITGTISNLLPKLNWAKEHGHARILQSSSLIIEDGKTGILNAKQRIPYQTAAAETGQPMTNFADVGISTEVSPKIVSNVSDTIGLNLSFSVGALVGNTNQGPLISEKSIKTSLIVRSGASAAVGGLITNDSGTDYNKLPALSTSNPIFSLYASKAFRRNQSQFVVFVTPIIKSSASAGAERIKQKFRLQD